MVHELKGNFSQLSQTVVSHSASIKQLDTQVGKISMQLNARTIGGLPSDTIFTPKNDAQVLAIVTMSGKTLDEASKRGLSEKMTKAK